MRESLRTIIVNLKPSMTFLFIHHRTSCITSRCFQQVLATPTNSPPVALIGHWNLSDYVEDAGKRSAPTGWLHSDSKLWTARLPLRISAHLPPPCTLSSYDVTQGRHYPGRVRVCMDPYVRLVAGGLSQEGAYSSQLILTFNTNTRPV